MLVETVSFHPPSNCRIIGDPSDAMALLASRLLEEVS